MGRAPFFCNGWHASQPTTNAWVTCHSERCGPGFPATVLVAGAGERSRGTRVYPFLCQEWESRHSVFQKNTMRSIAVSHPFHKPGSLARELYALKWKKREKDGTPSSVRSYGCATRQFGLQLLGGQSITHRRSHVPRNKRLTNYSTYVDNDLDMGRSLNSSAQTRQLLEAMMRHPRNWQYGYELSKVTGLKSGTLYPLLMRLSDQGFLESCWQEPERVGRPPRHAYRLTSTGLELARSVSEPELPRVRRKLAGATI